MINWKVRFRNKTWLLTFLPVVVTAVYNILALLGVVPKVSEDMVLQVITTLINLLAVLGIITDPTTEGIADSTRALGYTAPCKSCKSAKKTVTQIKK